MKTISVSILAVFLVIGCLAFSKKPASGPLPFETVLAGQHSLIDTSAVFVVDNAENWNRIWHLAQGNVEPMPELQPIDFEKYNAIAVFMGTKNSSGYSVEISEISRVGDNLYLKVINHIGGGGMMLPVITTPYHIVKITAGDYELNIEYTDQKE